MVIQFTLLLGQESVVPSVFFPELIFGWTQ